jgi:hypothetical protein
MAGHGAERGTTMLDHEEMLLFGVAPGRVTTLVLQSSVSDAVRTIWVTGKADNRRTEMTLTIRMPQEQSVGEVFGAMMALILRSTDISSGLWRRTLWAIHNRLGREGYEVEIRHCGKDPMQR